MTRFFINMQHECAFSKHFSLSRYREIIGVRFVYGGEFMAGADVQRLAQVVLFREWTHQMQAGVLPRSYLLELRVRLDEGNGEFVPGAELDAMRVFVGDALGVELDVPDFPPDDDDTPRRRDW
jgi:hypothetical protein